VVTDDVFNIPNASYILGSTRTDRGTVDEGPLLRILIGTLVAAAAVYYIGQMFD